MESDYLGLFPTTNVDKNVPDRTEVNSPAQCSGSVVEMSV